MSFLLRSILTKLEGCSVGRIARFSSLVTENNDAIETEPIISISEAIQQGRFYEKPKQVWLENLDTIEEKKLGLMMLHPEVFGAHPRIDILHQNVRWQRMYKFVCYAHTKTRAEVRGGGRKPWQQKGLGRARHGSIRSPLWRGGGVAHGPRSPTTHFYMLPFYTRVLGLTSALTVKFGQDDLHIVNDLEIPTTEPGYIEDLVYQRNWGPSVLFVDVPDIMPKNITLATDEIKHFNLMPVYGLNVYSMLKHDTLVLTENAAREIESKILLQLNRMNDREVTKKFRLNQQ
ncbi:large ribosomal subunit protein uL4m [Neodiprion pinetum]|uniref:Large ribosomal subunit protein uL4m n=1 Tax=Neodiprion lecontei TaxID=441921 RepID=A0A6J0C618_NEOLC|nr:39S ribosomal protein L4, mitochondrial [Neodiprion lecontei]XP_046473713.1 39S ribosomal protein L4, mitochondrial [Neodiprion pinetum]